MDASEVTEVCRLCPATAANQELLKVFDERFSEKNNIKEVILVTTGIEILETDIISKKICRKCLTNTQNIYQIQQTALRQTEHLKEKCKQLLDDKGIRLPNTCITIKRDHRVSLCPPEQPNVNIDKKLLRSEEETKNRVQTINNSSRPKIKKSKAKGIHPSVIDVYRANPRFKLPKKCLERHIAPIVSLAMGEVETYFTKNKLNMAKYIYKPKLGFSRPIMNKVAKKKTSAPTKTVSPLKIRRSSQNDEGHNNNYTCSSVYGKTTKGNCDFATTSSKGNKPNNYQKKSQVLVDNDNITVDDPKKNTFCVSTGTHASNAGNQNEVLNSPENLTKTVTLQLPKDVTVIRCGKDILNVSQNINLKRNSLCASVHIKKSVKRKLLIPKDSIKCRKAKDDVISIDLSNLPLAKPSTMKVAKVDINGPTAFSKEKTEDEEAPLPNTSKPEFIQSLGLKPADASLSVQNPLLCRICNSRHPNVAAFKKHSSRHRVCPHCKLKFKTIETKQHHIDYNCQVRKILESPGSFIGLEKVELNLELRKQYSDAFLEFERISGLEEINHVVEKKSDVIVLSDDESQLDNSVNYDRPEAVNIDMSQEPPSESFSSDKPIVGIYNNNTLEQIGDNLSDIQIIKELIIRFRKNTTLDHLVETTRPCNNDISVNPDNTIRIKNLKGNLSSYMIPVVLNHGEFRVSYGIAAETDKPSTFDEWTNIPLVEKQPRVSTTREIPLMNYPLTFVTSQVQSSQLALSSIQLMAGTPTMSIFLPNTSTFIQPGNSVTQTQTINPSLTIQAGVNNTVTQTQTINSTFFTPINNTSIQTTPLLQNYTLSMGPLPIINSPVPIQSQSITSSNLINENASASSAIPSTSKATTNNTTNCKINASKKTLSSKAKKISVSTRRTLLNSKNKSRRKSHKQIIKVKIGNLASCRSGSKSSKVRVRNIWELK